MFIAKFPVRHSTKTANTYMIGNIQFKMKAGLPEIRRRYPAGCMDSGHMANSILDSHGVNARILYHSNAFVTSGNGGIRNGYSFLLA
ncbi:MAG: hypothetical protein C4530_10790 [Desulfobacteraceae bacterium]|nr:MAG: hypothetical protein C4530_10790 [Desulfobacteraceae bacterium]